MITLLPEVSLSAAEGTTVGIGKKVTGATSAAFLLATSVVTLGFVSQATPAAALPLGVSVTTATG